MKLSKFKEKLLPQIEAFEPCEGEYKKALKVDNWQDATKLLIDNLDWLSEHGVDMNQFDIPEIRKLITDSYDAYLYCKYVKDRPELWKLITDSHDAYMYCKYVQDRPEVRKFIKESQKMICLIIGKNST